MASVYRKCIIISGIVAIVVFAIVAILFLRNSLENEISKIKFDQKAIYLILRGTDSKSGIIANKYNKVDKNVSHIGIATFENNELEVFHVSDELSNRGDNLFYESLKDFISRDDLLYFSIWKIKNLKSNNYNAIRTSLLKSLEGNYNFDREISLNNDRYYCSEYVHDILAANNVLSFRTSKILLKGAPKIYLKRDTLEYYPVDGFMKNPNFEKIFEWKK